MSTLGTRSTHYSFGGSGPRPSFIVTDGTDIYCGNSAFGQPGDVYRVQTLATPVSHSTHANMAACEGVTFHDGKLYGADRSAGGSQVFDVTSGTPVLFTSLAPFGADPSHLTFRPATDHCYVTAFSPSLYEFDDTGTHVATHADITGTSFHGGRWHGDKLYLIDRNNGGRLVAFDPATSGFSTVVGSLNVSGTRQVRSDLVFASNGRIYFADGTTDVIWSCTYAGADIQIDDDTLPTGQVWGLIEVGGVLYASDFNVRCIWKWTVVPAPPAVGGPTVGFIGFGVF